MKAGAPFAEALSLMARCTVGPLGAGELSTTNTGVPIPASTAIGKYNILAKADDGGVVTEANEANNVKSKVVHVGPDLAARS